MSGYTSMSGILGTVMVAECQRLKVPERENCEVRRSNDMVGPVCSELHIAPSTITTVSNSDIILINAVPVHSAMTG